MPPRANQPVLVEIGDSAQERQTVLERVRFKNGLDHGTVYVVVDEFRID